jgi:hypothetical protein
METSPWKDSLSSASPTGVRLMPNFLGDAIQIEASVRRQGSSENTVTELPHRALPEGAPDRLSQRPHRNAESKARRDTSSARSDML